MAGHFGDARYVPLPHVICQLIFGTELSTKKRTWRWTGPQGANGIDTTRVCPNHGDHLNPGDATTPERFGVFQVGEYSLRGDFMFFI